jgi:HNH endonuclease
MATKHYILPLNLRSVHAFHEKIQSIIKFKLNLAILSIPDTSTLKEKLFKKQKGICGLCGKIVRAENLLENTTHIHHIKPIYNGGNKLKLSNLALVHI